MLNNALNFLHLSAETLTSILIVTIGAIFINRLINYFLNRYIQRSSKLLLVNPSNYSFFKSIINFSIFAIAFAIVIYSIPPLKKIGMSMLAGAGIFAAIIGFASQATFSNIISGFFVIVFQPFRVGDRIKIGQELSGIVENITIRHIVIRDFENKRIIIPNSVVSAETIVNADLVDPAVCRFIDVSIAYEADIDKAMNIMKELALGHPLFFDHRSTEDIEKQTEAVDVRLIALTDSGLLLRAYVWAKDQGEGFRMHTDLNKQIVQRFNAEGIEIPYPHVKIVK